jgi:hypothetical protein
MPKTRDAPQLCSVAPTTQISRSTTAGLEHPWASPSSTHSKWKTRMKFLAADQRLQALLAELTLEDKVQLLTGRDFWTTWPLEKIGLRRIVFSDGPSGVRGGVWDEREPSMNFPSAAASVPPGEWTLCLAPPLTSNGRRWAVAISRRSARSRNTAAFQDTTPRHV